MSLFTTRYWPTQLAFHTVSVSPCLIDTRTITNGQIPEFYLRC